MSRFASNCRRRLPRRFYTRPDVTAVARDLLGTLLVVPAADGTRVSGMIVETEAYCGFEDRASHAYNGRRTARTETMYQVGGTAYVYFVYGMHYQFNVVTNTVNVAHAVLVRALEPIEGVEIMRQRRSMQANMNLTNGPGKLCQALAIDRSYDRADLLGARVWIEAPIRPIGLGPGEICVGPRVGVDYAGEWAAEPLRFWIAGNPYVSRSPRTLKCR